MSDKPPTFAIIGAAGYIAGKHLDAIYCVGGRVLGACDPHDAAGVLDRYDDQPAFFTGNGAIERFDRWLDRQNRGADPVDYVVVCSPNHLHDSHARLAMRAGSWVILEKPACLTERNLDAMLQIEMDTGRGVNCILQLRNLELPLVQGRTVHDKLEVLYRVRRGPWYDYSWKGDPAKSGGPLTNIGIHIIDLLNYKYGDHAPLDKCFFEPELMTARKVLGSLWLDKLRVYVQLEVRRDSLLRIARVARINGTPVDLSVGMDGHKTEYERILRGDGWDLESVRPAIRICEEARG